MPETVRRRPVTGPRRLDKVAREFVAVVVIVRASAPREVGGVPLLWELSTTTVRNASVRAGLCYRMTYAAGDERM